MRRHVRRLPGNRVAPDVGRGTIAGRLRVVAETIAKQLQVACRVTTRPNWTDGMGARFRYEHLPIYRQAFAVALHLEQVVAGFSRYHKHTLDTELRQASGAMVSGDGAAMVERRAF
jgi:hypothetical protein